MGDYLLLKEGGIRALSVLLFFSYHRDTAHLTAVLQHETHLEPPENLQGNSQVVCMVFLLDDAHLYGRCSSQHLCKIQFQ